MTKSGVLKLRSEIRKIKNPKSKVGIQVTSLQRLSLFKFVFRISNRYFPNLLLINLSQVILEMMHVVLSDTRTQRMLYHFVAEDNDHHAAIRAIVL